MKVQFSKLVLVLISMIFLVSCGGGGGGVPTTANTATIPNINNISSTNNIPISQKNIGSNFIFNSSPKQNQITTLKINVNNTTQIDDIEWSVSNEPINSHLSIKVSSDKKSLSFTPQISGEYKITAKVKYDNQYYSLETLSFTIKEEFALDLKNLEVYDHPISKDVNFNLNEVVSTVKNQFWVFSKSLNESQLRSLIQTTYSDFTIKGYDPIYGLLVETNNLASIELLRKRSNIDKVYNRVYVGDNAYKTNAIYPIDNGNFDDGGSNWHLEVINMPEAWEYTTGNDNFLIGVCDGGFDNQHNDLQNRFAIFLTNQEDSHGMGVTGAIAANSNNGIGISGINWSSQVVASYMGDVENTINAIQNNKVVRLISNSWGYAILPNFDPTNSTMTDKRFLKMISVMAEFRQLVEQRTDKLFIWAAGNGVGRGTSSSGYYGVNAIYDNGIIHYDTTSRVSSKLNNLIIVGAFISDKRLVYYSNFGDTVDIAAPTHFDSLALNNQIYQNFGGTSASTPVVSGIASLIISINPNLSPAEVKSILINSATEYITERYVSPFTNTIEKLAHPIPILNAREALRMASETLTSNKSPIVNVESNKNADETTTVTLNATASDSDGSIEKIEWKQIVGTTVTINNQNTLNASFTAPNVDVDTDLTFRLTVTDNDGATASDDVVVTIKNVVIPNQSPTVTVEDDKNVDEATTVSLNGGGSDIDGSISSYFWEQVSGTTVNIINQYSANASFIAPNVDSNTDLTFRLTVTDDDGATASDDVVVTVLDIDTPLSLTITDDTSGVAGVTLIDRNWVSDTVTFTFKFSKAVTGFDSSDITVTNATKGSFSGSGDTYTLEVTPPTHSTKPISISVGQGVAKDTHNNSNSANSATQEVNTVKAFITTWDTTKDGNTSSNQVKIKTSQDNNYSYNIDWGDNEIDTNVIGDITHTYNTEGTYNISITGDFPHIIFNVSYYPIAFQPLDDNLKLLSVEQWGTMPWKSMYKAFYGCKNLVLNTQDNPNLSNVTNMMFMFHEASSFNQNINSWNVSNVTDTYGMFWRASSFNQPLDNWDVSNVTTMGMMFAFATNFNQPLNNWNVSNVKTMLQMFRNAEAFNQPLNSWDVSSVTYMGSMFYEATNFNQPLNSWDVSNVTYMGGMFYKAIYFNQYLGDWDVSHVTDMDWMFSNASSFNQDLGDWDVSRVHSMSLIFSSTNLSTEHYNNLLFRWSQLPLRQNLDFYIYPTKYSSDYADERQYIIDTFGWTISDGGLE